ncbi:hypothetical protein L6260_01030, partial [Candidatus Parcubacteria bacterium]|nr:hypothetical protein [Candidatus Parcubacteria bacterium]
MEKTMRNSHALAAFLFAMALVAVAVFNTKQAMAGLMPQFLMSEEACLARGEPPEFCAYLAQPETDSDAKAEEPTVWIPRSAIPVWREVPLSQIPAPEPVTGLQAGNMIIWDFPAGSCADPRLNHTGHGAREMAAQDATVLRSLAATLAQAQADMAWSLTES